LRRGVAILCASTLGVLGGVTFGVVGERTAQAVSPCGITGVFTAPAKCAYTSAGTADTFTVPAGVTSVHIVAIGAPGATGPDEVCANNSDPTDCPTGTGDDVGAGGVGGDGAANTSDIPVSPTATLNVEVGSWGGACGGNGGGLISGCALGGGSSQVWVGSLE